MALFPTERVAREIAEQLASTGPKGSMDRLGAEAVGQLFSLLTNTYPATAEEMKEAMEGVIQAAEYVKERLSDGGAVEWL